MIDKLHNVANAVLGIEDLRVVELLYRFIIINSSQYIIDVKDNSGNSIKPIKQTKDEKVEYSLDTGIYYLRCYSIIDNEETKEFYQEIYVSEEMLGTSRTIKL